MEAAIEYIFVSLLHSVLVLIPLKQLRLFIIEVDFPALYKRMNYFAAFHVEQVAFADYYVGIFARFERARDSIYP